MIPEIDIKKLNRGDEYERRNYVSSYLRHFIMMPLANFDNKANKLSLEYVYKLNDLLEEQKQLMCFYDCIQTYAYAVKDKESKYYTASIYQTSNSIRSQRRHIRCVKDCVKRTMLTKELALILDKYIATIDERIKYLTNTIVPIHINITPLAALYHSCIDNGEEFFEKMIDFILPDEINVYKNADYDKKIDYTAVNKAKAENSQRLYELVNDFNEKLKSENEDLYNEYMSEYFDFINGKSRKERERKEYNQTVRELKKTQKVIAAAETVNIAKKNVELEKQSVVDILTGKSTQKVHASFLNRMLQFCNADRPCFVLYKNSHSLDVKYIMKYSFNGNKVLSSSINIADAQGFSEDEWKTIKKDFESKKTITAFDCININDYIDQINKIIVTLPQNEYEEQMGELRDYADKVVSHFSTMTFHHKNFVGETFSTVDDIPNEKRYLFVYYSKGQKTVLISKSTEIRNKVSSLCGDYSYMDVYPYTKQEVLNAVRLADAKNYPFVVIDIKKAAKGDNYYASF